MAKVRYKWNLGAFEQVRRLPAVRSELGRLADEFAAEAGDGYEAKTGSGRTRDRAAVLTTSYDAIRDNSKNNTLVRIAARRGRKRIRFKDFL